MASPSPDLKLFPATALSYFHDSYLFVSQGTVLAIIEGTDKATVVLDKTIFHPQGGGQPSDVGEMLSEDGGRFIVTDVRSDRESGVVQHSGTFHGAQRFAPGAVVRLQVDEASRRLHARLHSAGHLLDSALKKLGYLDSLNLVPNKGYHFPSGPYVEYKGDIPVDLRDKLQADLQEMVTRMIAENTAVEVHLDVAPEHVAELCGCPPEPSEPASSGSSQEGPKAVRVVKMGQLGCPCGGTHVKKLADLEKMEITKIKVNSKKLEVKISYKL